MMLHYILSFSLELISSIVLDLAIGMRQVASRSYFPPGGFELPQAIQTFHHAEACGPHPRTPGPQPRHVAVTSVCLLVSFFS